MSSKKTAFGTGRNAVYSEKNREELFFNDGEVGVGFAHALATFVFFADFFYQATGDEVLQFFVGAQTKHFLAARYRIADFQFFKRSFEQIVERENFVLHEDADEFIGDMVREAS